MIPEDLNKLIRIPDEHIRDGRHSMAQCEEEGCRNPVTFKMTIEEWPFGEEHYNTKYWCEEHGKWILP